MKENRYKKISKENNQKLKEYGKNYCNTRKMSL